MGRNFVARLPTQRESLCDVRMLLSRPTKQMRFSDVALLLFSDVALTTHKTNAFFGCRSHEFLWNQFHMNLTAPVFPHATPNIVDDGVAAADVLPVKWSAGARYTVTQSAVAGS